MIVENPVVILEDKIRTMAIEARGEIKTIYLHWTAGCYGHVYDDYHLCIDRDGTVYVNCKSFTELKAHTWRRNTDAIGIALCCGVDARCWLPDGAEGYKWNISHGKDPSITHFHEDELDRRWNSTQENWINIGDDDAEDQIGSVFAVQGIDLNKVGVMIGPDIVVNDKGILEADPDKHNNTNNKFSIEEMNDPDNQYEFTLFILNQYYVLLTRGIDGIRVGFWDNDAFRKYMEETLGVYQS